jgi:anti-sigma regulatory factor (Ser/Thr protein kinase)
LSVCCEELWASQQVRGIDRTDPAFHLDLDARPIAAGRARRFVAEHAGDIAGDGALTLLTSELVTNGVLHARTHLRVGIATSRDHVLVTVADDDGSGSLVIPPPDDGRPSGRGLLLVDAIASQWGVFRHPGGKTVWFTLPRTTISGR